MSKNSKKRKRKKGKKRDKGKLKKTKIIFSLDDDDLSNKEVFDNVIDRLKSARKKVHRKNIAEIKFASDILKVIDEVITKYDAALSRGEFSSSPQAQHIFRTVNYMIAAYQNIEKMLADDSFKFLEDYYNVLNLHKKPDSKDVIESKLGNMGKQHIPLLSKQRKFRKKKEEIKKKRRGKPKNKKKNKKKKKKGDK